MEAKGEPEVSANAPTVDIVAALVDTKGAFRIRLQFFPTSLALITIGAAGWNLIDNVLETNPNVQLVPNCSVDDRDQVRGRGTSDKAANVQPIFPTFRHLLH